jgi:hypothetical protein
MSASIFISFASRDQKVAATLCKALESRGFTCWISSRDIQPGENFQVAIVRAIREARILLLVFTANSNTSEEMTKELALASQNKMIVVPLRIEEVTPNEAFSYEFATRQWIDFFADWESAMEQLSRRLTAALGSEAPQVASAIAPPAEPQAPPPRKSRMGLFVAIGAGLLILAGAGGYLATSMLGKKSPPPAAPPASSPAKLVASAPAPAAPAAEATNAANDEAAAKAVAADETPRPKRKAKGTEESSGAPSGEIPF